MKMNLSFKLVIGYSLMALLLLICGIVGYNATQRMSQVSDFLVGQARDMVQGALETSNGVREQIKAVDDLLAGRIDEEFSSVQQQASQHTDTAFNTMLQSGLISTEQTERLNVARQAFGDTLQTLLSTRSRYLNNYTQLVENADQLRSMLTAFNELANRIIVERETNWDTDEVANSQQSEEWFAASAAVEAKLALFAQQYYYQRFLDRINDAENEELIKNSGTDLDIYIEDLASMPLAEEATGANEQVNFGQGFTDLHARHKQLYSDARQDFIALNNQNKLYIESANRLLEETAAIEEISSEIINKEIQGIRDIKNNAFLSIFVTVIVGMVLVVVAYWVTYKTVVTPIRQVAKKLCEISAGEGDLTQQLPISGSDEIARLAQGFNGFTGRIRELIQQLIAVVNQLGDTSTNLADQSNHTQQQMLAQQQATEAANLDMDDMSSRVDDVGDATHTADERMRSMDTTLQQSQQVIGSTLGSINEFAAEIESATDAIEQLNRDSQEVVSVIDVIQGIAEQTNLLALNAAIEAARAGEQGRGFAVVADEVRTLASRTQQSTTEIQAIIDRLQTGANRASEVMHSSREKASATLDSTGSASESLSTITTNISDIKEIIGRITQAASLQNEKKSSMLQNLENISQINQETTASGSHLAEITQQLNDLAGQLQLLVGRFRV